MIVFTTWSSTTLARLLMLSTVWIRTEVHQQMAIQDVVFLVTGWSFHWRHALLRNTMKVFSDFISYLAQSWVVFSQQQVNVKRFTEYCQFTYCRKVFLVKNQSHLTRGVTPCSWVNCIKRRFWSWIIHWRRPRCCQ